MAERLLITSESTDLVTERWRGGTPVVVLLHEGVSDKRGWREVAALLAPAATVVAYDRRGFGETPPSPGMFSHVADVLVVLDHVTDSPAWLVGASAGGGIALDTAILAAQRVAGLVLLGSAVSGAPAPDLDSHSQRFDTLLDRAYEEEDAAEINRLETWLWLDGPAQPEGRVTGQARVLALDMNAIVIANRAPEATGGSGVDAWNRLAERLPPRHRRLRRVRRPVPHRQEPPAGRASAERYLPDPSRHGPPALPRTPRPGGAPNCPSHLGWLEPGTSGPAARSRGDE